MALVSHRVAIEWLCCNVLVLLLAQSRNAVVLANVPLGGKAEIKVCASKAGAA
jgi:hypothetical protein